MIIRNRNNRPVFENVTELNAPLKPSERMLGVVVRLISGKEQKVRILLAEILHDRDSRARRPA